MTDHKEGCDCCVDIRRAEQELAHLQPEEEPRCPKCGAQVDERYDCCEVAALTIDT